MKIAANEALGWTAKVIWGGETEKVSAVAALAEEIVAMPREGRS